MSSEINNILIIGIDDNIKNIFVKNIKSTSDKPLEIKRFKTLQEAPTTIIGKSFQIVIIEYNIFPPKEICLFLEKLQRTSKNKHTNIIFITDNATRQAFAIGSQYNVFSVLEKIDLQQQLKEIILKIRKELATPSEYKDLISSLKKEEEGDKKNKIAEELYRKYPIKTDSMIEYANRSIRKQDYKLAEQLLTSALEKDPNNLRVINALARTKLHLKKGKEAIEILKKADILSPKNAERLILIGDTFTHLTQYKEAEKSYSDSLGVDSENLEAKEKLGTLKLEKGDIKEAMNFFSHVSNQDEIAAFFNNAGILSAKTNKIEHAQKLYSKALKVLTSTELRAKVHFNIGLSYEKTGKKQEAKEEFSKASKLDTTFTKAQHKLDKKEKKHKPKEVEKKKESNLLEDLHALEPEVMPEDTQPLTSESQEKKQIDIFKDYE